MVKAVNLTGGEDGGGHQPARAEAALWVVRGGGRQDAAAQPLDAWLGADPANADAYEQTLSVWEELGYILPDWKRDDAPPVKPQAASRLQMAMPAAAMLCLLLVSLFGWNWYVSPTLYHTGIGERRIVALEDGTQVTLNTDTEIAVSRPGAERRLTLLRGEALFNVAHDASRPFIVESANRYVRALGTSFIVRKDGERLDVTLLSGLVRVGAIVHPDDAVQLRPGDRYRLVPGIATHIDRPSLEMVTAWRNGELILDQTPLSHAVAEMNRYRDRPIELRGDAAPSLKLSGVFRTAESDGFANSVAVIYDLRLVRHADGRLILEPKTTPAR